MKFPKGEVVVLIAAVVSTPYNIVFHPTKTYRLLVHKIGWYE